MRASPITQHKLLLQTFLQTSAGRTIGNEIASANGASRQQFEGLVHSLPPYELLMPYREQRLSWTWDDPGIEVAAAPELHAHSVIAYDASGGVRTLTKGSQDVRRALVELRPERLWSRRMAVKPYVPGSVIQDADENEISGTFTTVRSNGRRETIELAELPAISPPFAMGKLAPGDASLRSSSHAARAPSLFGTSDTTWLISIQVSYQAQDWNSTQDPYFNACYKLISTQTGCTENTILRFYGLQNGGLYELPGPTYYPVAPLLVHRVTDNSMDQIEITVRERDTLTGYGLYMGTWDITWENKIWTDPFNGVFFYVDYPDPPAGPPCYKCLRAGLFSWEKAAPPPPPPPPLAVTMTGPSSIRPNSNCTWAASVNGGVTPYTYAWKRNGTSVSTSSSYDGTGNTTFTLALTVTDHANSTSTVSKTVSISSLAALCNQ
jgi:hypothetical protein